MNVIEEKTRVIYRPMKFEDLEQVRAIDVLSFPMPWPERSFHYELSQNPHARLWVAESYNEAQDTSRVAGMIVIWLIIDEAHIATFAVHPDFRHQGIGRRLLAHSLLDAYQAGARRSFLEVRASNLAAQALYTQFGFVAVETRPHYYQDNGEDAILMNLDEIDPQRLHSFVV